MLFVKRTIWHCIIATFVLLLPGVFLGRSNAKAMEGLEVKLQFIEFANICGSDEFTLLIKSNEVYAADSLYGFKIDIRYNPDEITFNNVVWNNTLGNQCDNKPVSYETHKTQPKGGIFIQADKTFGTGYLKGNLPYVILKGKYRSKCNLKSIIYMNEFTALYEFGTIRYEPIFQMATDSIAIKNPNANNIISTSSSRKAVKLTTNINSDTVSFVTQSNGSDLRADTLSYILTIADTNNFKIDSCWTSTISGQTNISYISSNKVNIKYYTLNIDNIKIVIYTRITSTKEAISDSLKTILTLKLENISDCNCVASTIDDSITISYFRIPNFIEETAATIREDIQTLNKYTVANWINDQISNTLTITTTLGQKYQYTREEISLKINEYPAGIYLISLDNSSVIAKYLQY